MFFKERQSGAHQLKDVISLIEQAFNIVYSYKENRQFMPTEEDIELFEEIEALFYHQHSLAGYVTACMEQRMAGKPEGVQLKKGEFIDFKMMD